MKEIKYIGFYDIANAEQNRATSIPAINKMDYICEAITKAGYKVHLVSPSWFEDPINLASYKGTSKIQLNPNVKLTLTPSFGTANKITSFFKIILSLLWLLIWLIINVKRNEKILVYHSQWLSIPIRWAKKIKKFQIILEVEEIYSEVWQTPKLLQKWEYKLIKAANYFIAVSDVLAEILGDKVKIVIYGNYKVPVVVNQSVHDDFIHLLYAGSIDHVKGGAYSSVICSKLLPENYKIHICGFGCQKDVVELKNMIFSINRELNREACIFHGKLLGSQFEDLLNACQIAINPQKNGQNMTTSFPSKIIKYLAYNLRVVSTPIKSIVNSKIADLISFSDNETPGEMVKAILKMDFNSNYDSRDAINKLDAKFVNEIKILFRTN